MADLDQWMRWFGAMAIIANGETNASNGADDDYSIYRGVGDPRFEFVPHDLDTILGDGDGSRITDPQHTIFDMISGGAVLDPLVPLFSDPTVQTRYYQALRELRLLVFQLRSPTLDSADLISRIRLRLDNVENRSGITGAVVVNNLPEFSKGKTEDIYRIAIEALNNSLKHAKAEHVAVTFTSDEVIITMNIEDDGEGFDIDVAQSSGAVSML